MRMQMDFLDAILNENATAKIKKEAMNSKPKLKGYPHNPKRPSHTQQTKKSKI